MLVSIVMPTYNAGKYVRASIEAIINQSYKDWELLITDDCSSDNTCEIVSQFVKKYNRIRFFKLKENSGAGVARNNCIKEAKGKIIAFCDSDDRWLPTKLEKEIKLMEEKHCDAVYSSYFVCSDEGEIKGIVNCRPKETAFSIKCDDKMGNLTFMYNEERTGKLYMPTIRKRQDWAHKMMVMNKCKIAYGVQEPLAIYRHSVTSISKKKTSLAKYNILGFMSLGWSRPRATLFFLFVFLPSYFMKRFKGKLRNNNYTQYLHLIPESMLHETR